MARFIPNLKVQVDLNRFCFALGLGFLGALFTANMGMGAPAVFLLSLIAGTGGLIGLGGRYRVFHAGVFGTALVGPILLSWSRSSLGPTAEEVLLHVAIGIALPMALAGVVSWILRRSRNFET